MIQSSTTAVRCLQRLEKLGKKILLPVDAAVAASFPNPIDAQIEVKNVSADAIPADMMGLDIGTESAKLLQML